MDPQEISDRLRTLLLEKGAALVGFADLNEVPLADRREMPFAVSLAFSLAPSIAAQISAGPNQEYFTEYKRINQTLLELGGLAAEFLQNLGYQAIYAAPTYTAPTDVGIDPETLSTILPHKTVATRSGLGWIGKCALLVTEEFGSAVRLTTVLTDAELVVGRPVDQSRCGACDACVEACPAQAPSGREWRLGLYRDSFFNPYQCRKTAGEKAREQGIDEIICGICIAVCPWTQKFIDRSSTASR
ncbi:MAG: epoxyqueuosine reductase [Deltaproteobacteria bacterium]|nr:epoxyqueuosine reductase [Deltaproteobacteria bacterium]